MKIPEMAWRTQINHLLSHIVVCLLSSCLISSIVSIFFLFSYRDSCMPLPIWGISWSVIISIGLGNETRYQYGTGTYVTGMY